MLAPFAHTTAEQDATALLGTLQGGCPDPLEVPLPHLQGPSFTPQRQAHSVLWEWHCLAEIPVSKGLTDVLARTEMPHASFMAQTLPSLRMGCCGGMPGLTLALG